MALDGDLEGEEGLSREQRREWVLGGLWSEKAGVEALRTADPRGLVKSGEVHGKN